jgi:hypothetical protein
MYVLQRISKQITMGGLFIMNQDQRFKLMNVLLDEAALCHDRGDHEDCRALTIQSKMVSRYIIMALMEDKEFLEIYKPIFTVHKDEENNS